MKRLGEEPYLYPDHIQQSVAENMVFEGDKLMCNCDEDDSLSPVNILADLRHEGDVDIINISHTEGGDFMLRLVKNGSISDNICFKISTNFNSWTMERLICLKETIDNSNEEKKNVYIWFEYENNDIFHISRCGGFWEVYDVNTL